MASVMREMEFAVSAERCWDALRDFGALDRRLAVGFITQCRLVSSDVRQVSFASGAVAKERLVGVDEHAMRLAYTVIESAMGSSHHNASAQVIPAGPCCCRFLWTTDVLPDDLADRTAELMEAGLLAIKATIESD